MSIHKITLTVDGKPHERTVDSRKLLAHFLRDDLNITTTNIGCDTSQCGACTVFSDGEAIKSCTVLAVQADGTSIETVASQASAGELGFIQQAFQKKHGLQCGYCTPGMVMTTAALLASTPDPDESEIREALHGNICRCTGYHNIVEAVQEAANTLRNGGSS